MKKTYRGSCHCGVVRFEVDLDLTAPSYRCNCTICRRNRFWAAVAKEGEFRLLDGEEQLTKYLFNTAKNEHYFCQVCGVRPFGIGTETPIGPMYGVNLGCLEGVTEQELAAVPIHYVNGLHDEWSTEPEFTSHL